ncbi:glycosyltransferase family 2 protein [Flexilinea flocculi]|jgi:glycosyltransferase involved in cell wall biosynthesis|uniref:Glycosyltransferase n=1 Tax=Flexilinea flocculi TaxID=1678840 RepID=A0A0K8P9B5_9CHLR|nr:glycosyltransferase family 2 protein [Flexilinea flocculi]NMB93346.1 glycosyltransferase family 2 protein [Flexilinea flocculi]GAP39114.1 glycosyltransferase [Flexilinea flocculi]
MYLSVIAPVYNEHDNIPLLYDAVKEALKNISDWEFILVDDGSVDESLLALEKIAMADPQRVKIVSLRRNFGQTAAIAAGVDHASGDIIVLMDADLQNDPVDIPRMLEKIEEGYDLVSGWRKDRKDSLVRTIPSRIANKIICKVTGVSLHDYGCTLKAYRREVLTGYRLYGEMHRFIPAFANSVGAKIMEMPVTHHPRKFGKANYGMERTAKVILDLFTVKFLSSYANKPIYLFGGTGLVLSGISGCVLLFLAIRRLFWGVSVMESPLFQMSAMIFILGFQSILMGLIAELLTRAYYESQDKKTYYVRKMINFDSKDKTD